MSELVSERPYVRRYRGRPLVVLTAPARQALVIRPDGQLDVQALAGVQCSGAPPITQAQVETLRRVNAIGPNVIWQGWPA